MLKEWRNQRAVQRVKPGNGRQLKRFRWWQNFSRSLFHLPLEAGDGRRALYAVEVKEDSSDGVKKAHLYLDGRHHAQSKLPAVLPVPGGTIEVRASTFGLKRCHYVTADGTERQLVPDPRSAEGKRAHLDHAHPALSRWLGAVSVVVLLVSLALLILQLLEQVTQGDGLGQYTGVFTSPVSLPAWANTLVGAGAAVASTERALRLRHHWLLDGGAG